MALSAPSNPATAPRVVVVTGDADSRARYGAWLRSADVDLDLVEAGSQDEILASSEARPPDAVVIDDTRLDRPASDVILALRAAVDTRPAVVHVATTRKEWETPPAHVDEVLLLDDLTPQALQRAVGRQLERRRLMEALEREEERCARLEREIDEMHAEVEQSRQLHRQFLAAKSHDLRSPLNALIGYSEMLQEELESRGLEDLFVDAGRVIALSRRLLGTIAEMEQATDAALNEAGADSDHFDADDGTSSNDRHTGGASPSTESATTREDGDSRPDAGLRDTDETSLLIIDDDDDLRDLLALYLESEGYQVATASNGEDGLRRAQQQRPTAILLDVQMPGMDGWDVLGALKSDPRLQDVPVIMFTGRGSERVAAQALRHGVDDYLMKGDITAPALQRALQGVLERSRLRRAVQDAREALEQADESLAAQIGAQTAYLRAHAAAPLLADLRDRQLLASALLAPVLEALPGGDSGDGPSAGPVQVAASRLSVALSPPNVPGPEIDADLAWLARHVEAAYGLRVTLSIRPSKLSAGEEVALLLFHTVRTLLLAGIRSGLAGPANVRIRRDGDQFHVEVDVATRRVKIAAPTPPEEVPGESLDALEARLIIFDGRMNAQLAPDAGLHAEIVLPATFPLAPAVPAAR